MKKFLCLALSLLMLLPLMAALPLSVSAETALPSGQIWEGETDLRREYTVSTGIWGAFEQQYVADFNAVDTSTNFPGSERTSGGLNGLWKVSAVGEKLEFKLDVKTSGKKTFYTSLFQNIDVGNFKFYFDGEPIGEVTLKIDNKANRKFVEYTLGEHEVTPGIHTLTVECTEKGNFLIDYFEMVGEDGTRRTYIPEDPNDVFGSVSTLVDGTIRYEGEKLTHTATGGSTKVLGWGAYHVYYSGNFGLLWTPAAVGNDLTFEINAPEAGEYKITLASLCSTDIGKAAWYVNGTQIFESVDGYAVNGTQYIKTISTYVPLNKGINKLSVKSLGAGSKAKICLDYVDIKVIESYELPTGQIWEGEDDLRKNYTVNGAKSVVFKFQSGMDKYNNADNYPDSQRLSKHYNGLWVVSAVNDELEIKLDVKTEGKKTFYMNLFKNADIGTFEIWFDDKLIDTLDLYIEKAKNGFFEYNWGPYDVTPGAHTLKIKCTKKGNFLIDYFEMVGEDGVRRTQKPDYESSNANYGIVSTLDDGTIRYEGEKLTSTVTAGTVYNLTWQGNYATSSYGIQLGLKGVDVDDELKLALDVPEAGQYRVTLASLYGHDAGRAAWFVNGAPIFKDIDYFVADGSQYTGTISTVVELKQGANELTAKVLGKNDSQTGEIHIFLDYVDIKKIVDSNITGRNLTVGQDLSVTYYADVDAAVIGDYSLAMQFAMKTTTGKDASELVAPVYDEAEGRYSFRFEHLAPQVIGEDINVSLVLVDGEGNIVKTLDTATDSIKKYLVSLAEDTAATAELKTLVSDLLTFGQASKDYLNATAVKDIVDDEIKAKAWFVPPTTTAITKPENDDETNINTDSTGVSQFVSAGVRVGSVNKLFFVYTADATKTVTVKVGDKILEATDMGGGKYIVYTDGIYALNHGTPVEAELQEGGATVQTITLSINGYAYLMQDDDKAGDVITALYRYGASAAAYVNAAK